MERVAIARFDNQSADTGASLLGAQIARIVALQLAGAPDVFVYIPESLAESPFRRATQLLTGYLTTRGDGQWLLHAQLRDAVMNRSLRNFVVSGSTAGALADGVSGQLGKPGFSAGKLDRTALESALDGRGDASILGAVAQTRLARLPADLAARAAAVARLSQTTPADSETAYAAAALLMQVRQFPAAALAYQRARRADPDWVILHNEAAFGFAFAGDLPAALAAIDAYRKLDPKSANPEDSQGEILFLLRRFSESERAFLAAFDKDPAFYGGAPLRKAAEARRAAGNQAEADRIFARRPPNDLENAQWDYTSGRAKEALASLEAFAAKTNASPAWTQLAAWRAVNGGDAAGAAQLAMKTARTQAERQSAAIALSVTQAGTPDPKLGREALIYSLAIRRRWTEALPLIAAQRDALSPPQATCWQALLAVALAESGQTDKAKTEARLAPIPRTFGDATWDFLVYPGFWKIAP